MFKTIRNAFKVKELRTKILYDAGSHPFWQPAADSGNRDIVLCELVCETDNGCVWLL